MKKLIVIFSLFVIAIAGLAKTPDRTNLDKIIQNYLFAAKSTNHGVRHDTIYQLVKLRCAYPNNDLIECEKCLKKMSTNDTHPIIRLHAQLALAYWHNDNLQTTIKVEKGEDSLTFFNRLYQAISTGNLAMQL